MCDSNGLRSAPVGPKPTSTGRCGPPHAPEACVLPITPHSRKSGGRESVSAPLRSVLSEAPLGLQHPAVSLTPLIFKAGALTDELPPGKPKQKDRLSGFPSKRS